MKGQTRRPRATRALPLSLLLLVAPLLPAGTASAHTTADRRTTTTGAGGTTTTTAPFPAPSAPVGVPDTCVKKAWAPEVEGQPLAYQALSDGAYLWLGADGSWALRVTHTDGRNRAIFSGSLTLPRGKFVDVGEIGKTGSDIVAEGPGGRTIVFRFVNFGPVDGLDFSTRCATALKVNLHMSGALLPATDIHLGANEVSPPGNPFRVQRAPLGSVIATTTASRTGAATTSTATARD